MLPSSETLIGVLSYHTNDLGKRYQYWTITLPGDGCCMSTPLLTDRKVFFTDRQQQFVDGLSNKQAGSQEEP